MTMGSPASGGVVTPALVTETINSVPLSSTRKVRVTGSSDGPKISVLLALRATSSSGFKTLAQVDG